MPSGPADKQTNALSAAPPFEPVNPLEELLIAASRDPALRGRFNSLLLESNLYAATPEMPDKHFSGVLEKGSRLDLLTTATPDGAMVAALFTSIGRVSEAFGAVGYVAAPAENLLDIVSKTGAILNPGLAYGVHWQPRDLGALLGKPEPRVIGQETTLRLEIPSDRPEALVRDLRAILSADPHVDEAWLALAVWPQQAERSWYLDIRTRLDVQEVRTMLQRVLRAGPFDGLPLDMIVRPAAEGAGIGIRLAPAGTQ